MTIKERHESLKKHLEEENPVLLEVVQKYELLDNIGYKTGFLEADDSYTGNISWWPIISVLGTFSAGKSTFINNYMDAKIQDSGNQAVDDKFTAICYGHNDNIITLPGIALNSDPRFPFYGISNEIDNIEQGEGDRVNLYMQLKTVKSDSVKGRVFIDSPGFDADNQRNTILRMTKHIIDISDLVLIFFDARHPEPGAMRDTLEHLVQTTMNHADADKVLYILNQIDTTSKEDNLEDVISAWQRALAQTGLITGNFFTIYNENSADAIKDEAAKERLQNKKNEHLKKINNRIDEVSTERAYRIASMLHDISQDYRDKKFPKLKTALTSWSKKVFWIDLILFSILFVAIIAAQISFNILSFTMPEVAIVSSVVAMVLLYIHFYIRKSMAKREINKIKKEDVALARAFAIATRWYKPMMLHKRQRWNHKNLKILDGLMKDSKRTIQKLNDQFITSK
ncbi:MAG: dynamin family protein [Campylobacterota bacterium]|nr:dynamin family protein [Campylobacterota bacterium]